MISNRLDDTTIQLTYQQKYKYYMFLSPDTRYTVPAPYDYDRYNITGNYIYCNSYSTFERNLFTNGTSG